MGFFYVEKGDYSRIIVSILEVFPITSWVQFGNDFGPLCTFNLWKVPRQVRDSEIEEAFKAVCKDNFVGVVFRGVNKIMGTKAMTVICRAFPSWMYKLPLRERGGLALGCVEVELDFIFCRRCCLKGHRESECPFTGVAPANVIEKMGRRKMLPDAVSSAPHPIPQPEGPVPGCNSDDEDSDEEERDASDSVGLNEGGGSGELDNEPDKEEKSHGSLDKKVKKKGGKKNGKKKNLVKKVDVFSPSRKRKDRTPGSSGKKNERGKANQRRNVGGGSPNNG